MKILVLAENYTSLDGVVSLHYIHSRNRYYLEKGIDVSVISFRANSDYVIDGIKVYTEKSYREKLIKNKYEIILSHAPNLKNHLRFLKKYKNNFNNIIFYFHGHEVLRTSKIYPKPYKFTKKQRFSKRVIGEIYDMFKLFIWNKQIPSFVDKSEFVFVSNWMYDMFIKFTKVKSKNINKKTHIIYNCVGKDFESISYDSKLEKEYDFITIRSSLDGSKYGIDIVTNIAKNNPQYKFCVVGKGDFYNYFDKPDNLKWIDKNLTHEEVLRYLNKSKCALLPTRADAQGVMACEMATFGIPLITSNIDVCKEVFDGFKNVDFIDNNKSVNIEPMFKKLKNMNIELKNEKYFAKNTVDKEIRLFNRLVDYDKFKK